MIALCTQDATMGVCSESCKLSSRAEATVRQSHLPRQTDDGELEAEVGRQEAVVQCAAERRLQLLRLGDELVCLDGEALRGTAAGVKQRAPVSRHSTVPTEAGFPCNWVFIALGGSR